MTTAIVGVAWLSDTRACQQPRHGAVVEADHLGDVSQRRAIKPRPGDRVFARLPGIDKRVAGFGETLGMVARERHSSGHTRTLAGRITAAL